MSHLSAYLDPLLEHQEGDINYLRAVYPEFRRELDALSNDIEALLKRISTTSPCLDGALVNNYDSFSEKVILPVLDESLCVKRTTKEATSLKVFSIAAFDPNLPKGPSGDIHSFDKHPFADEIHSITFPQHLYEVDFDAKHSFDPNAISDIPATWIDTDGALEELGSQLLGEREISVDLENHSYYSYHGYTCLLQISTRSRDFLIDTVALRKSICKYLGPVFQDGNILKIFHGAESDIAWFQRDFGVFLVALFDSYHASKKLDLPRQSLAYLISHYFDVDLDKKYQTADWRMRPLSAEMLLYAQNDTRCLFPLFDSMRQEVIRKHGKDGLTDVLKRSSYQALKLFAPESIEQVVRTGTRMFPKTNDQKLLRFSADLVRWREETAIEQDVCPHAVCSNQTLHSVYSSRKIPVTLHNRLSQSQLKKLKDLVLPPVEPLPEQPSIKKVKLQSKPNIQLSIGKFAAAAKPMEYCVPMSAHVQVESETGSLMPPVANLDQPSTSPAVESISNLYGREFSLTNIVVVEQSTSLPVSDEIVIRDYTFPEVGSSRLESQITEPKKQKKVKTPKVAQPLKKASGSKIASFRT